MTPEMWLTLAILLVALLLFISDRLRVDLVALGVMTALIVSGVLTIDEGIAGFSNKAVLSIAALFIVGGAVFQTGLAATIAERILNVAQGQPSRLIVILMVSVAVMSAFISSTGVVALMLPAVVSLAGRLRVSPSRLLIPMAYSALLGGSLTLIGTPPNLLASEALVTAGLPPFDLFSFTPLGLILLAVGVIYMLTLGQRWLPDRRPPGAQAQQVTTPVDLLRLYELPGSLFRLRVQDDSPLVGGTVGSSGLRDQYDISVLSIAHPSTRALVGTATRSQQHSPGADAPIRADDVLLVQGPASAISQASGALKLAIMANEPVVENDMITNEVGIAEVLLRPRSTLLGRTLTEIRFGTVYRLTVLDIRRPGTDERLSVKDTPLKLGDVLLVQGEWKHIFALKQLRQDFIVMGEREAAEMGAFTHPEKAPITLAVLAAMVMLVALNIMELTPASLIAAIVLILTGCITMNDAYASVDLKTIVLMAGMLPMSTALQKVGLVDLIAGGFTETLGGAGALPIMAGLFTITVVLTQVLSNTATAVLVAPIAVATAQSLGVQPQAFLMAVAVAASMAFATPLASPVNTLVLGTGNYRFNDYVRIGVPLIVLCLIVSLLALPVLWPL